MLVVVSVRNNQVETNVLHTLNNFDIIQFNRENLKYSQYMYNQDSMIRVYSKLILNRFNTNKNIVFVLPSDDIPSLQFVKSICQLSSDTVLVTDDAQSDICCLFNRKFVIPKNSSIEDISKIIIL